MNFPLDFHPNVHREVEEAYDWYEQHKTGLGRDFLDELQKAFEEIAANPARYGFADNGIREGLLRRFPYAVYYRELSDRVRILAVFHTSQDPSRWQSRN